MNVQFDQHSDVTSRSFSLSNREGSCHAEPLLSHRSPGKYIGGLELAVTNGKQAPKQDQQVRNALFAQMLESSQASTIWKHWNLS
jgi:hypothetical protein